MSRVYLSEYDKKVGVSDLMKQLNHPLAPTVLSIVRQDLTVRTVTSKGTVHLVFEEEDDLNVVMERLQFLETNKGGEMRGTVNALFKPLNRKQKHSLKKSIENNRLNSLCLG